MATKNSSIKTDSQFSTPVSALTKQESFLKDSRAFILKQKDDLTIINDNRDEIVGKDQIYSKIDTNSIKKIRTETMAPQRREILQNLDDK